MRNILLVVLLILPQWLLADDFSLGIGGDFIPKRPAPEIRRSIGYHFSFEYLQRQRVGFEAAVGWNREALFSQGQGAQNITLYSVPELERSDGKLLDGRFSTYWLELSPCVVLYRHIEKDFAFNLGAGIGFYYAKNEWTWDVKQNINQTAEQNGVFYKEDPIRPNIGYNIRASFDFPITVKSRLRFESKYLIYRPAVAYSITHGTELNLSGENDLLLDGLYFTIALLTRL